MSKKIALIIGAGPAGLAAAYRFLTETDDRLRFCFDDAQED